jgi:hypothetical protein
VLPAPYDKDPSLTGESIETTRFPCCFCTSFAAGPVVGIRRQQEEERLLRLPPSRQEKAVPERPARTSAKAATKPDGRASTRKGSRRYRPVVETPTASTAAMPSPPPAAVEPRTTPSACRTKHCRSGAAMTSPRPSRCKTSKASCDVWLPLAQYKDTSWQRSLGHNWQGNFDSAGIYRDPVAEMEVFYADWKDADRHAAASARQSGRQAGSPFRHHPARQRRPSAAKCFAAACRQATWCPTTDWFASTAERAIGRIKDPVAQGKAIYDWVVENTSTFDPTGEAASAGATSRRCSIVAS